MDVAKLLQELPLIPDIEVVVALLPEVGCFASQLSRHALFERLERLGECPILWFSNEQMYVIRHHDISIHAQAKALPHAFEGRLEYLLAFIRSEQGVVVVAGKRNKVSLS